LGHVKARSFALGLAAALSVLFSASASGDTIELRSGERVEGAFRQATTAGVVIEVAGQAVTIPLDKVQAIYFGSAKPSSPSQPAPSQEALDALKGLRSVTESGISYRDYAPRVLDAKVKVDRYLSSQRNDSIDFRKAIGLAMREYELASQAWSLAASSSAESFAVSLAVGKRLDEDPEISKCPSVRQFVDQNRSQIRSQTKIRVNPDQVAGILGQLLGSRPATLWACASAQVAEAERLLAQ
jgi:hypothetical protein